MAWRGVKREEGLHANPGIYHRFYYDPGSDLYPDLPGGIWRSISVGTAVSASSWNFVLFFGSVYEEKADAWILEKEFWIGESEKISWQMLLLGIPDHHLLLRQR